MFQHFHGTVWDENRPLFLKHLRHSAGAQDFSSNSDFGRISFSIELQHLQAFFIGI
jgi:hypothetical protein